MKDVPGLGLTCRSVSRLLVSRTRALVASSSIRSFSCVSFRQEICVCAELRFCSPSLTISWRWDTWGGGASGVKRTSSYEEAVVRSEAHLLIGHVDFGRQLLLQVVQLLLQTVPLLLQGQPLDLKLLAQFLDRKEETEEETEEERG